MAVATERANGGLAPTMANGTMAPPRLPSDARSAHFKARNCALQFIKRYYTHLNNNTDNLHLFYGKDACMNRMQEGQLYSDQSQAFGRDQIRLAIQSFGYVNPRVRVTLVDYQASFSDSVLVSVHGYIESNGGSAAQTNGSTGSTSRAASPSERPRRFMQTFLLVRSARNPMVHLIRNDIFRYVADDTLLIPPDTPAAADPGPSSRPKQAATNKGSTTPSAAAPAPEPVPVPVYHTHRPPHQAAHEAPQEPESPTGPTSVMPVPVPAPPVAPLAQQIPLAPIPPASEDEGSPSVTGQFQHGIDQYRPAAPHVVQGGVDPRARRPIVHDGQPAPMTDRNGSMQMAPRTVEQQPPPMQEPDEAAHAHALASSGQRMPPNGANEAQKLSAPAGSGLWSEIVSKRQGGGAAQRIGAYPNASYATQPPVSAGRHDATLNGGPRSPPEGGMDNGAPAVSTERRRQAIPSVSKPPPAIVQQHMAADVGAAGGYHGGRASSTGDSPVNSPDRPPVNARKRRPVAQGGPRPHERNRAPPNEREAGGQQGRPRQRRPLRGGPRGYRSGPGGGQGANQADCDPSAVFMKPLPEEIEERDISRALSTFGAIKHVDLRVNFAFVYFEDHMTVKTLLQPQNRRITIRGHDVYLEGKRYANWDRRDRGRGTRRREPQSRGNGRNVRRGKVGSPTPNGRMDGRPSGQGSPGGGRDRTKNGQGQ